MASNENARRDLLVALIFVIPKDRFRAKPLGFGPSRLAARGAGASVSFQLLRMNELRAASGALAAAESAA